MRLEQHNIFAFSTCCIQVLIMQKMNEKLNTCQKHTLNDLAIVTKMIEDKMYVINEDENLETLIWNDWNNHSCILLTLKEIWIQNSH